MFFESSEKRVFNVPDEISLFRAVFTEPLSTIVNSQEVIKDDIKDKTVVVVGAGPLGLLHVMLARTNGAKRVILVNKSEGRLNLAIEKGIIDSTDTFIDDERLIRNVIEATQGKGADVVIMATTFEAVPKAVEYLKPERLL